MVIRALQRCRQREIRHSLPDALDLLSVSIASGSWVEGAMREVTDNLYGCAPVLCDEFRFYFQELELGRSPRDAMHDMAQRAGIPEMMSFVNTVIQSRRLGGEIAEALSSQATQLREARSRMAEEKAQMAGVKLLIPLVLCIFPGIFVVLVGPAAIMIMRDITAMQ
jgi:tight adherence protein C